MARNSSFDRTLVVTLGLYAGVAALVVFSVGLAFATRPWDWSSEIPFAFAVGVYCVGLTLVLAQAAAKVWRIKPDALKWARFGLIGATPLMMMLGSIAIFAVVAGAGGVANVIIALSLTSAAMLGLIHLLRIVPKDDLEHTAWEHAESEIGSDVVLEPTATAEDAPVVDAPSHEHA